MRYQIRFVPTGKNFRVVDDSLYVRIPDMILQLGRKSFSVNCMRLSDDINDPSILGDYFHPYTVVEVIEPHQFLSKKEFDELYKAPQSE